MHGSELPAVLRAGGLKVGVVPDFASNGHDGAKNITIQGHLIHHTADHGGLKSVYAWPGKWGDVRPDVPSPRCNLWWPREVGSDGIQVWCVSSGRAYHAGNGSTTALADIRAGRVSARTGNAYDRGLRDDGAAGNSVLVGHEVENRGVASDPYPDDQLDRLARGIHLINVASGLTPGHVGHHRQYTRRKGDMSYVGDIWTRIAQINTSREWYEMSSLDPNLKDELSALIDARVARLLGYAVGAITGGSNSMFRAAPMLLTRLAEASDDDEIEAVRSEFAATVAANREQADRMAADLAEMRTMLSAALAPVSEEQK